VRVAYVLLHAPGRSETFIVDERAEVAAQGAEVTTVVLEGGAGGEPGAVEVDRLSARSAAVGRDAVALVARRPQALRALMVGPLTFGLRFKLLAVARRLGHVDVVHAHFAYRSADAAEVLGRALGCGHSFTAHAHDIFVDNAELGRRTGAARLVVTVCEYNRRWMAARYGAAAAAKIHVIPCSVRVDRPVATTPAADPIVLAIARLVPKKGLDTLLDAFAKLAEPARLVIVGEGPLAGELAAQTEALGLTDRVAFVGGLDHEQAMTWYGRAAVFCLPCRIAPDGDRDSMPVVIKEAMAAGLPVVSTTEVAVPEMVDDGVTGLLVEPDDAAALAGALDRLLADPALRERMGAAGRDLVARRFDLRRQARRLLAIWG